MTLADLKNGEEGIIIKVRGRGAFRKRIIEMGFVKGKVVKVIKNAPLKDPIEYKLLDYYISLRRSEASLVDVYNMEESETVLNRESNDGFTANRIRYRRRRGKQRLNQMENQTYSDIDINVLNNRPGYGLREKEFQSYNGVIASEKLKKTATEKSKTIDVALVGNPNSGKTTLFNFASGSRERVGNYGGVTVGAKKAKFKQSGYRFNIIDLPGTYSITEYTPEELYVRNYIFNNAPDVVINIIDASNLERNLYLTTQLIDMDIKVIVALNMYDELEKKGDEFDYKTLGQMIGIPFVPTVSSKGKGIEELFNKVIEVYEDMDETVRHIHINYGSDIETSIKNIQEKIYIEDNYSLTDLVSSRFLAIKLLEKDKDTRGMITKNCINYEDILNITDSEISKLEPHLDEESETLIINAKYGFIAGALREVFKPAKRPITTRSEKIDNVLTHRIFGFPIFIFFIWLMFQLTFTLGEYPMKWIELFIGFLSNIVLLYMPGGIFKELIVDGIIAGVGGVIVFLPNILILFFMISLMEDTGYMARASFIVDKLMHKIGLHGKSFIPMIMGFGCNVPAIMATRTLESRNDRILTMLIIPFMSCSARLPVYLLFVSAFFSDYPGSIIFLIYMIGIFVAILSAVVMKKTLFGTYEIPFVIELPPYRIPHLHTTSKHMWEKGVEYLKKIGGIILIASIIIWALGKFPKDINYSKDYNKEIKKVGADYQQRINGLQGEKIEVSKAHKEERSDKIEAIKLEKEAERLERSYIGRIGHFIEPVIRPLGFDWKIGVSIITGLAAKEIVISTMGVLYSAEREADEKSKTLIRRIKNQRYSSGPKKGERVFSSLTAFGFIIFVLLYFPCIAVIATIKRESGSWKWAIFTVLYTTGLAWIVAFLINQVGSRLL